MNLEDKHLAHTQRAERRFRWFVTFIILSVSLFIAFQVVRVSNQVQNQTRGITIYLDCVGHLPVVGRKQSDVDKCLVALKETARIDR